jgi:hypothetical protein
MKARLNYITKPCLEDGGGRGEREGRGGERSKKRKGKRKNCVS